ncbi:MAG TPA: histidine triad nucleotide-binding protein [Actinomycetota bacterium]|nr:histidine triad nucleotide-binding protein [Actinomycetota bacterium]
MSELLSGCPFCRIVTKEVPAEVVHSSDHILAFRDARPVAPVHILLVPKEHVESIAELNDKDTGRLAELVRAAVHLAKAERIDRSGWRLLTNVGPDGGQSVFHLHFHLLGGRRMGWPPG